MEGDFIHWKTGPSRYGVPRLVNKPTRVIAEGLAWIKEHLNKTTPDGIGLPIEAMEFIDTAIKKGRENDNTHMRRESGLHRI
jgi:hypothetical protein